MLPPASPAPVAEYSPFYGIEKGAVLQEARIFHDPNLDPRRCSQARRAPRAAGPHPARRRRSGCACAMPAAAAAPQPATHLHASPAPFSLTHPRSPAPQVITKLLYLLNQGETFTKVRVGAPPAIARHRSLPWSSAAGGR